MKTSISVHNPQYSDLYDRAIVGWEVYETESAEHASELVRRICLKQKRLTTEPQVLYSDNGSSIKGATMLATLYQLGITDHFKVKKKVAKIKNKNKRESRYFSNTPNVTYLYVGDIIQKHLIAF